MSQTANASTRDWADQPEHLWSSTVVHNYTSAAVSVGTASTFLIDLSVLGRIRNAEETVCDRSAQRAEEEFLPEADAWDLLSDEALINFEHRL